MLDDQATAKKYEGQGMVVTGTLNATHNTIYMQKIEAVCELPVYRLSGFNTTRHSDARTIPPPPQPELPVEEPPYPDAPTPNPGIPPFPPTGSKRTRTAAHVTFLRNLLCHPLTDIGFNAAFIFSAYGPDRVPLHRQEALRHVTCDAPRH